MVDAKSRELLDKLAAATDNARIKLKVRGHSFRADTCSQSH